MVVGGVGGKGKASMQNKQTNKKPEKRIVQNTYVIILHLCKILCVSVELVFKYMFSIKS